MFLNYPKLLSKSALLQTFNSDQQSSLRLSQYLESILELNQRVKNEKCGQFSRWAKLFQSLTSPTDHESVKLVMSFEQPQEVDDISPPFFAPAFRSDDAGLSARLYNNSDVLLFLLDEVVMPESGNEDFPMMVPHPRLGFVFPFCSEFQDASMALYLTEEQCQSLADYVNAKNVALSLEGVGLLADWIQLGPDNKPLNMVLMLNKEFSNIDEQRHFATHVYDGREFTQFAPEWLRNRHAEIFVRKTYQERLKDVIKDAHR